MPLTAIEPANKTPRILSGGNAVLIAAVLWSTSGLGVKFLAGLSPIAISSGRSLLCGVLFLILARGRLSIAGVQPWRMAVGIVAFSLVVTTFVISNGLTGAANAIILQYTSLLWIVLLEWITVRARPRRNEVVAMTLGAVGIVLCMWNGLTLWRSTGEVSRALQGDALAIFSGLCFAMITIVLRGINRDRTARLGESEPALVCLVFGNLLAGIYGLPALVHAVSAHQIHGREIAMLVWMGGPQLGGGYWFYQYGLRTTRALTANLLSLLEPLLNPMWVAVFVGELPSRMTFIGAPFVLAAVVLALAVRREER